MATPAAAEHRDIEQRFRNIERTQTEQLSMALRRQPIQVASLQVDRDNLTFPDAIFSFVSGDAIPIPDGYTQALVTVFAAAGCSFSSSSGGNVGVQPLCNGQGGPPISTGAGAAVPLSASSTGAFALAGLTPGSVVTINANVQRTGPVTNGSCNYHLSASAIFLR